MAKVLTVAKVFVVSGNELLLIKRSMTDNRRPGQWDIPGGHTDEQEFAEEAAARETIEEVGISVDARKLVLVATRTKTISAALTVHWLFYVATTASPDLVTISHEHDDFTWVTTTEALQLITYDIQYQALRDAIKTGSIPR